MRTRPDFCPPFEYLSQGYPMIDYKTCQTIANWGIKNVRDFGLILRVAGYWEAAYAAAGQNGAKVSLGYLLQEKSAPYTIQMQTISPYMDGAANEIATEIVDIGRKWLLNARMVWKECKKTGKYPSVKPLIAFGEDFGEGGMRAARQIENTFASHLEANNNFGA